MQLDVATRSLVRDSLWVEIEEPCEVQRWLRWQEVTMLAALVATAQLFEPNTRQDSSQWNLPACKMSQRFDKRHELSRYALKHITGPPEAIAPGT